MAGIGSWVLSALFPRACVGCHDEGEVLCASCAHAVLLPEWHEYYAEEGRCATTRFAYKDKTVRMLLHAWKYQGDTSAGEILCAWFASSIPLALRNCTAIVPVPLAREAYAERGFNQAEHLARALSSASGIPVCTLLDRYPKRAQAKTAKDQRENIRAHNPYMVKKHTQEMPQVVALVDDVFTTGNTVLACADTLVTAGVRSVAVFTLAHGSPS